MIPTGTSGGLASALLAPRSVALVGASDDPTKTSARPLQFLRRNGFAGTVYPVNPRRGTVLGERAWPSLADLPEVPDHAFVLAPTEGVFAAVRDCVARGVKLVTVLAGGYGEDGPEGHARAGELAALLRGSATRLLGPNSIGVVNPRNGLALTANGAFAEADLPLGGLFVASHSGSMIGAILSRGKARGVGFAGLVSVGAELDLSLGEICAATLDDASIDAYALFLESIRHGPAIRRFALAAAALGRPVIAYKLGRSAQAADLAQSHTGAIAGEDGVADIFLKGCGIARVDTLEGLIEGPALLRRMRGPRPTRSPQVAVVTTTGGAAAMVVDQLGVRGVAVVGPTPATMASLAAGGVQANAGGIVDLTLAGTRPAVMQAALDTLLAAPEFDLVVAVAGSSARFQPELLIPAIIAAGRGSDRPLAAFIAPEAPEALAQMAASGQPCFRTPEACADAIAAAFARRPCQTAQTQAVPAGRATLDEAAGYRVLAALGIPVAAHAPADASMASSPIGYPVAAKLLSAEALHKTELGGVVLNVRDDDGWRVAITAIQARIGAHAPHLQADRLLAQRMVSGLGEVLLSFRRDPEAGPMVILAAGGVLAELHRDRSLRLAPVDVDGACAMMGEVRALRALEGFRGRPRGDLAALARAIVAISHAGAEVIEAEINPLIICGEGDGCRGGGRAGDDGGPGMIDRLGALVNADALLVHRGRFIDTVFLLAVGDDAFLIRILDGRVITVTRGPFVMPRWSFALRASAESWAAFWEPAPKAGFHDLFALIKSQRLSVEGDIHPFMANLFYFKALLAKLRGLA